MVSAHWRRLLVQPEGRSGRPLERAGAAFDPENGLLFVGTSEGRFFAVETGTGRVRWVHDRRDGFHGVPLRLADPPLVVAGADDGTLLAFEPLGGSVVWAANLGGPLRSAPVVLEGVVYLRTSLQEVFAVEASTGRELWSHERPLPEGYVSGAEPGIWVDADRLVTGFSDGVVVALSPVTGEKLWEINLAGEGGAELLLDDVCATPIRIGDTLVVASYDNGLFGLSAEEGTQFWVRSDLTRVSGLAAIGTDVLAAVAGVGLARIDSVDGARVWMRRFPAGTLSSPVVRGGVILVTDDTNGLLVFEALTGILLDARWQGEGISGPPAVTGNRLVVLDNSGELFAYHFLRPGFAPPL
jgi:outer membrane protein assembly factor BamB